MASPWARASRDRSSSACTSSSRTTRPSCARPWRLEDLGPDPKFSRFEMSTPPSESLLTFPCVFPIKVVGRREDGYAQTVSDIVLRHAPDFHPDTIEMRASRNGRYL